MKLVAGLFCVLMVTSASTAQGENEGTCADAFTVPAEAGMRLSIDSKPAGIEVVGTDAREIRVTCTVPESGRAHEVRIRYRKGEGTGQLAITNGPDNNVQIVIEIPHQTHLRLHMGAGAIHVKDVTGDKDIDVDAGEVTITGVNPQQYRSVDASVDIGEVRASAFSVNKGGFFRSFKRSSAEGLYRLDAHIITGSIQLN